MRENKKKADLYSTLIKNTVNRGELDRLLYFHLNVFWDDQGEVHSRALSSAINIT